MKRLTDEELATLERNNVNACDGHYHSRAFAVGCEVLAMATELRARRQQDLTAEDVEALRDMKLFMVIAADMCTKTQNVKGLESSIRITAVLDRLIKGANRGE